MLHLVQFEVRETVQTRPLLEVRLPRVRPLTWPVMALDARFEEHRLSTFLVKARLGDALRPHLSSMRGDRRVMTPVRAALLELFFATRAERLLLRRVTRRLLGVRPLLRRLRATIAQVAPLRPHRVVQGVGFLLGCPVSLVPSALL